MSEEKNKSKPVETPEKETPKSQPTSREIQDAGGIISPGSFQTKPEKTKS